MKAVAGQLRRLLTTAEAGLASQDAQRELLRGAMDRIQGVVAKLSAQQEGNTPRTEPLSRLRALAAARRHPIRIEQEGSGPKTVGIRSEAFDRALGHLIDNAVAASQQGQRQAYRRHAEGGSWPDDAVITGHVQTFFRRIKKALPSPEGFGYTAASSVGAAVAQW